MKRLIINHTYTYTLYLIFVFLTLFIIPQRGVEGIDCFKCISVNNDYKPCEDPFHNNYTLDIFESPCMGGRKGRDGLYPATSCIKITGVFDDNGDTLVIRGCALDSGTLTTDTEIVRMSHCGGFMYHDRFVRGCVQSCNDADACNSSNRILNADISTILTNKYLLLPLLITMLSSSIAHDTLPLIFYYSYHHTLT